ncbi:bacteriorhodopsin [Hymenobacter psoromatis]|uniref:bacteriorhodopsin n=1 Tax=Hymenobacter psoromatis TaxID=1484116 RepID=UPI001CC13F9F|nr:bacteriorhodopsin [Hymenobacter psoromatis]
MSLPLLTASLFTPSSHIPENEVVGYSFFYSTFALLGAAIFFLFERHNVPKRWRVNLTVAGLICLIASVSYFYMQAMYVGQGVSPTRFRYTDWLFTVPLMCTQFYLLVRPAGAPTGSLWRLVFGGLWMIGCGFFGENTELNKTIIWGLISTLGYLVVLYEVWFGPLAKAVDRSTDRDVVRAFTYLSYFVLLGWAIYPMGYMTLPFNVFATLHLDRNLVYNFGDVINKVGFGLVVYVMARKSAARKATARRARQRELVVE